MTVMVETKAKDAALYQASVLATLKLRGEIVFVAPGSLPNDGKVIEDLRRYD